MPSLGQTTALLRRARRGSAASDGVGRPPAMSETTDFGPNPGGLRMLSYRPAGLAPGAALVVVLHGCTQSAAAFAADGGWLTMADRRGFAVLAPEQTPANNPGRCFNWFRHEDVTRGQGEAASIAAMVDHLVKAEGLDPNRVFVAGLSAGGAMTAVLLAAYPDRFAGGAVIAGLPYGVAQNVGGAMQVMRSADGRPGPALAALVRNAGPPGAKRPPLTIWHGDADAVVDPDNARDLARQWAAADGLAETPDEVQRLSGRIRSIWRSATDDAVVVELNLVHGLGHGVPLSTGGADGLGAAAPFMLEVGLSSTREIAALWGLAEAPSRDLVDSAAPPSASAEDISAPSDFAGAGLGDQVMRALKAHVPANVREIVAQALRAGGLMR